MIIIGLPLLFQLLMVEEPSNEPKETSPANLVSLKTQTASLRDQVGTKFVSKAQVVELMLMIGGHGLESRH